LSWLMGIFIVIPLEGVWNGMT